MSKADPPSPNSTPITAPLLAGSRPADSRARARFDLREAQLRFRRTANVGAAL